VNLVGFSVIHVSQGSVATYVRCGGMSTWCCIANFLVSLSVKEFLKSVKIWQSYCQWCRGNLADCITSAKTSIATWQI